jgi:hypothetical protein
MKFIIYFILNTIISLANDYKTPVKVRMGVTSDKLDYLLPNELKKWNAFYWDIPNRANTAVC